MRTPRITPNHPPAFTLVELIMVIVIIVVITVIAIPRLARGTDNAARKAFARDLRVYVKAAELYRIDHGEPLPDSGTGALPAGFGDYIVASAWTAGTPIGGLWDTETADNGVSSALGVHFLNTPVTRPAPYMAVIDGMIDDGKILTGRFRKIRDPGYYWVLEE